MMPFHTAAALMHVQMKSRDHLWLMSMMGFKFVHQYCEIAHVEGQGASSTCAAATGKSINGL